ncbi:hypothetical protein KI387_014618, partial [Taxus chinensis]
QLVSPPGVYCPHPSPDMMGSSLHLSTASQQSNPQVYRPMAESSVATSDPDTIQFNAGKWPFHIFALDEELPQLSALINHDYNGLLPMNSEGELIFADFL